MPKTKWTEEERQKRIAANVAKWGVPWPASSKAVKDKVKQSNLDKYGYESPLHNPEIHRKSKETVRRKYGVDNISQVEDIKRKKEATCLESTGYKYTYENPEILKKAIILNSTPEALRKKEETCIKTYGKAYWRQTDEGRKMSGDQWKIPGVKERTIETRRKTNIERYGSINFLTSQEGLKKIDEAYKKMELDGKSYYSSKVENVWLDNIGVPDKEENRQVTVNHRLVDGYLNDSKTVYEFSGDYWHGNPRSFPEKSDKFLKTIEKLCYLKKSGYRIMHCWESQYYDNPSFVCEFSEEFFKAYPWEDLVKVYDMIFVNKTKLYARNLDIKKLSEEDCEDFLKTHHLQNSCRGQEVRLGLFDENNLIQVITFGKPRYNKKVEWELLRLCTKSGYAVVGGSEKLFKHFSETCSPESVVSYCDNSKFGGEVYRRLGFNLKSKGSSNKHYYNEETKRHITDSLLRQRGYSQLHGDSNYELAKKGESNEKLMLENGYKIVYDEGQSTWTWVREN